MMDSLQPYRVAPMEYSGAPYDGVAMAQGQANRLIEQFPLQSPATGAAATVGSAAQTSQWDRMLQEAAQKDGFDPVAFDTMAERYRTEVLAPFAAVRGMSEAARDQFLGGFDAKAARQKLEMFGAALAEQQQQIPGVDPNNPNDVNPAVEFGANLLGGALRTVPGVIALADYGIRGISDLVGAPTGKTALGEFADFLDEGITQGIIDPYTSDETRRQQAEIAASLAEDPSLGNAISEYLGHGRNLSMLVAQGLGSFIPGAGTAGVLSKVARGAQGAEKLTRAQRIAQAATRTPLRTAATTAAAAGVPASGAQLLGVERQIREMPLEDLLADNPTNQALYESFTLVGLDPKTAETKLKDELIKQTLQIAAPAYLAGNVGLELIPGLRGMTGTIARRFAVPATERAATGIGGRLARIGGSAVSETAQESGAALLETGAENFGMNRPAGEGLAENLAQSALPAFISGGLIEAGLGRPAGQRKTLKKQDKAQTGQGARTAQEAAQGATDEGATPTAQEQRQAAVGPFEGLPATSMGAQAFASLGAKFDATLQKRAPSLKKAFKAVETPADAISAAESAAQRIAKDDWTSLGAEQRMDLIERIVTLGQESRGKTPIEGLGEALTLYKNAILDPQNLQTVQETGEPNVAATPPQETVIPEGQPEEVQDTFYNTLWDSLSNDTLDQNLPFAADLKAAFDAGNLNTVEDVKTWVEEYEKQRTTKAKKQGKKTKPAKTTGDITQADLAEAKTFREKLVSEFGAVPDDVNAIPAKQVKAEYNKRVKEREAAKKAAKKEADAKLKKQQTTKQAAKQQRSLKVSTDKALLQNYLAYLSDKPLLVAPEYLDVIQRDPRLEGMQRRFRESTETKDADWVKRNLEELASEGVNSDRKAEDNLLVGAILGNRSLKKASPAKKEARQLVDELKKFDIAEEQVRRMTLAQAREAVAALADVGVSETQTQKKKVSKVKKKVDKQTKEETPRPKEQAPVKEAGAKVTKTASKRRKAKPQTIEEKIRAYFDGSDLGASDIQELIDAVKLAQEGDNTQLRDTINSLDEQDAITADQKRQLRTWGREKARTVREITKEEINQLANEDEPDVDSTAELMGGRQTNQENSAKFKEWANNHDVIHLGFGDTYDGGPAVFEVVHGSTHPTIEEFNVAPEKGQELNFFGKGSYFTTSPLDAETNYVGVGPDLANNISIRKDEILDSIHDDPFVAEQLITEYLEANNKQSELDKIEDNGFDEVLDEMLESHALDATEWHARKELVGPAEGGVMYKVYVRLDRPFDTVTDEGVIPLKWDSRREEYDSPEFTKLIKSIRKVGDEWGLSSREINDTIGRVVEAIDDGVLTHRDVDSAVRGSLTHMINPDGEPSGVGQFLQEILRDTGMFDGYVMNAYERFVQQSIFGMRGVEPGTLHVIPLEASTQIKSAISNNGEFSRVDPNILREVTVAEFEKLKLELQEQFNTPLPETVPSAVKRRVQQLTDTVKAGEITPAEFVEQLTKLHERQEAQVATERRLEGQRGAEQVKAKLNAQLRNANEEQRAAIDFALWLLDNNPNIANDLALQLRPLESSSGTYSPGQRLLTINKNGYRPTTIVHEILHHSERWLPEDIQTKLRQEYYGRLLNKYKQAVNRGNKEAQDYILKVMEYNAAPSDTSYREAIKPILDGTLDIQEYYKYLEPSEYWAMEGSNILARKHKADSWIAKAREWLREYFEHVKRILGLDNTSQIYRGLNNVLKSAGVQSSATTLSGRSTTLFEISKTDEEGATPDEDDPFLQSEAEAAAEDDNRASRKKSTTEVTSLQRFFEAFANVLLPFEETAIQVRQAGGEVDIDTDPSFQSRKYYSDTSRFNEVDFAETVNPAIEWLDTDWAEFATDYETYMDQVNVFFGNKNFLERIKTDWMLKVALKDGKGIERELILEDMLEGEITPTQAREDLTKLVTTYAASTIKEHALSSGMSEKVFDSLQRKLNELAEVGLTEEHFSELNKLLDPIRDRVRQRLVEAGYFPEDDPWVEFYGWEWYVPLKGTANNANDIVAKNAFDLIPNDKLALAKLNKQIQAMEGRKSFAQRPFDRLLVDLARAGERSAHNGFMRSLYELVVENEDTLGAEITVFRGTPREGYHNAASEDAPVVKQLKPRGTGFIFNDGDTHYVVSLPRNSQLVRGLILMNNVTRPDPVTKLVSRPTNLLARAYTTVSPLWQTWVGFARDLTTVPLTVAAEKFDSPVQAASFLASYGTELLTIYRAAPAFMDSIKGDVATLRQKAVDDPTGYIAWLNRYEDAGGSNVFTKGFDVAGVQTLYGDSLRARSAKLANASGLRETAEGIIDLGKVPVDRVLEYTGNYANFLEKISRVAAFKALVESEGMSDTEAALRVRQVLDYQQTGTYGRVINSWLAFFRVGMTSVDTLRRVFRDQNTGKLNKTKLANWTLPFAGMSAMAYLAVAAMLGTDDEGRERMHKIRASTLTQKFILPVGDKTYAVNIGLGLPQVMLAPGTLTMAVMTGHITWEEAVEEMYNTISRNGPFRLAGETSRNTPSDIVAATYLGMTPTVLAPQVSMYSNIDTFGRPIHTTYPDPNKPAYMQGRQSTPPEFREIAKWLYKASAGKIDYYPEDVKYLAVNYGGQNVADLIKATVDLANKRSIGMDSTFNVLTARAEVKDEIYYDQERVFKLIDRAGEVNQRIIVLQDDAKQEGRNPRKVKEDFLNTHPNERAVLEAAKALRRAQQSRNKRIKAAVEDKTMSIGRRQMIRKEEDSKVRRASDALEKALSKL